MKFIHHLIKNSKIKKKKKNKKNPQQKKNRNTRLVVVPINFYFCYFLRLTDNMGANSPFCSLVWESICFLVMLSVVTWILSAYPASVWMYLVAFGGMFYFKFNDTRDDGMFKWFTAAKFVAALAGVVALVWLRGEHNTSVGKNGSIVVNSLLVINMFEALVRDVQTKHFTNAFVAFSLIATLPYPAPQCSIDDGWFVFHISGIWVLVYSSWNGAFTYQNNFAWTTRLILLPPLFVAVLHGMPYWIGARAVSLLAHLTMRAVHFTKFYTPGASTLTPSVGTVAHNQGFAMAWGGGNFICVLVLLHARFLSEIN